MANKILSKKQTLKAFMSGMDIVYDAVKIAYGPKGANVCIHRKFNEPIITHDGVTIANAISILDTDKNIGYSTAINLAIESSKMLNKLAGDGTSSVIMLSRFMTKYAIKRLLRGANPQALCDGIQDACNQVVQALPDLSEQVADDVEKLVEVATISCADVKLGRIIAEVMHKIGQDGVISVEPSMYAETTYDIIDGYSFGRGFISHMFITDGDKQECILENPSIIIAKQPINSWADLNDIAGTLRENRTFIVIANEIDDRVLNGFIKAKMTGEWSCVVVKAPSFADDRKYTMEDIEILTDAKKINDSFSIGKSAQVIVNRDKTTIIDGAGKQKSVKDRIQYIKGQIKQEKSETDKQRYKNRLASLNGKVAVLKVGGNSEIEIGQRRDRVDDAVCAVRSAMEDGIVPGGGTTYIDLARRIKVKSRGHKVLQDALSEPFNQLMDNSSIKHKTILGRKYLQNMVGSGYGIDVMHPERGIIKLKANGIIDPTIVIREVIKTSVSITATAITMARMIVDIKEPIKYETND